VADVVDTDPAALVIARFVSADTLTELLGDDDRVSALNEPPYPHIQVLDTPGGLDRDLRWLVAPEVTIKVFGDFDGTPGKAMLRKILYTALTVLRDLPDEPTQPGQPVVTGVEFLGTGGWTPEPTGQPCYTARPRIWMHPPNG
jgi:hypothetical protein